MPHPIRGKRTILKPWVGAKGEDSGRLSNSLPGRHGALVTGPINSTPPHQTLLGAQSLELGSEKEYLRLKVSLSCSLYTTSVF